MQAATFNSFEQKCSFDGRLVEPNPAESRAAFNKNPWKRAVRTASYDGRLKSAAPGAPASARKDECVVIVDPFSSGAILAELVVAGGRRCVRVFSEYNSPVANLVSENVKVQYDATVQHDDRIADARVAAAETGQR